MNGVEDVIPDAADNDYGRNGPHNENWHVLLLSLQCDSKRLKMPPPERQ
jgi:hypothetical protein